MARLTLYPAVDGVVQDTLALPYVAGSGTMTLASGGSTFSGNPTKFSVITALSYNQGPSEVLAVFQCTGQSGNVLSGVSALAGSTDQNFPAGSYVEIRINAIDVNNLEILVAPLNAPGATGYVLTSTGTGTAPTWQAASSGSGTVTTASVVSANGFAGTVANPTTTPAITLSTTVAGLLKGNGTGVVAATPGTDYLVTVPNPSASTLGGIESYVAVSHQWINAISTSGVPSSTQPAFSDISGSAAVAQLPVMVASGASHAAGIAPDPGASSGATRYLREDATWAAPAGSGTVNAGTTGQPAVYPASGSAVTGSNTPIVATVAATYGATTTFDLSTSNNQQVTLAGNPTLALSNVTVGQRFTINLIQDGTGTRTVTWFSGITWAGGSAPTLQTAPGAIDSIAFWCVSAGAYQGYPSSTPLPGSSGQIPHNNGTALVGSANALIDSNNLFNIGSSVSDPGTQVQGSIYSSSTQKLTYSPGPGMAERIRGRIFSCGSCAAVSNTTASTSILGSPTAPDGSLTIKANTLTPGDILRWSIVGVWQSVGQPINIQFATKLGSTVVTDHPSVSVIGYNQAVNGLIFSQWNYLQVVSVGSSGSVVGVGNIAMIGSSGGTITLTAYSGGSTESGTPITVNTAIDNLYDIQIALGTAATGNIFQVTGFSLWIM